MHSSIRAYGLGTHDLPFMADQLDAMAEHDMDEGPTAISDDLLAEARTKIRQARVLLMSAATLLGVEDDDDDNDE